MRLREISERRKQYFGRFFDQLLRLLVISFALKGLFNKGIEIIIVKVDY